MGGFVYRERVCSKGDKLSLSLNSGFSGMLSLAQELELSYVPISILKESDNKNKLDELCELIGYEGSVGSKIEPSSEIIPAYT